VRGFAGLLALLCVGLCLAAGPAAAADTPPASSSVIAQETSHTHRAGQHVVSFWWLPHEYWMAVARELHKTPAQTAEIRSLFRSYTMIAVLDVEVRPDSSFDALSTAEIVRRLEIDVNGQTFEVMHQVDPRMQQLAPDLAYVLRSSLSGLGSSLRLLPLPNLDKNGEPILSAAKPGRVRLRYRAGAEGDEVEFWWHAPLTAVAGTRRCKGGEFAEASWSFCPWDGSPVEDAPPAP
jgi:hypothetical protein